MGDEHLKSYGGFVAAPGHEPGGWPPGSSCEKDGHMWIDARKDVLCPFCHGFGNLRHEPGGSNE